MQSLSTVCHEQARNSISFLQDICTYFHLDIDSLLAIRKAPYIGLIYELIKSCTCKGKKNFLARSDHSLCIQKIRTPGIERHQHYSNCLDRNKYNRCICAIRGYDMSLSLWSFILKKIGSALRLLTCFRSKGFYKDQPCSVKNVGHLLYYSHLKGM